MMRHFSAQQQGGQQRYLASQVLSVLALACLSTSAMGHSADRGFVLLLPTGLVMLGGSLAVAASVILIAFTRHNIATLWLNWRISISCPRISLAETTSLLSFTCLMLLIYAGWFGDTDPLYNPLPLTIWTIGWVLLVLLHAIFGFLWRYLNPWTGLIRFAEVCTKRSLAQGVAVLPARLGYAPAVVGFFLIAWFELVSLAPEDPPSLAIIVLLYWCVNLFLMLLFGQQDWLARGEAISVFFRLLARLSMLSLERDNSTKRLRISLPGSQLLEHRSLGASGTLFVLLTLATVSFDGLNKTFWWLHLNGINPLAFAGRSTVKFNNTIGLLATFMVLVSLYLFAIYIGWRQSSKSHSYATLCGRLVLSLIPISLAYHFAHFLTQLLVNAQYSLKAYSDPNNSGADYLGFRDFSVTTSFLSHHSSVELIWAVQVLAVVAGHILSAILAHLLALRLFAEHRQAISVQAALAILMVFYTLFGLWLLSSPTGI